MRAKTIEVYGKRWFQRSYGNTYCTVYVYVNDKLVYQSEDMEYGYGDMYLQIATRWLEEHGFLPGLQHSKQGSVEPLWRYCERKGIRCHYEALDVARQKDLFGSTAQGRRA